MKKSQCTRRRILQATGCAAAIGLSGCAGVLSDDGRSETDPADKPSDDREDNHDEEAGNHDDDDSDDEGSDHEDDHNGEEGGDHEDDHSDDEEDEHDDDHSGDEGDEHNDDHSDEEGGDHDGANGDEEDEHGHHHDEGAPTEPSATAEVKLQTEGDQHHFAPHLVWIEPGGTVTWVSESGRHDAVAYHPDNGDKPLRMPEGADSWESELLTDQGKTFSHTFETEGVYDYFCTPHEAVGMVGTVIVGEPDPHGQPALEEPSGSLPDGARDELEDLSHRVDEALGHTH